MSSLTELFRENSGTITLMDYDMVRRTTRSLATGCFFVSLIMKQMVSSLIAMIVCSVEDFQWPITPDAPIIRVAARAFVFAFPGLLYTLEFDEACDLKLLENLVNVFKKYGHYQEEEFSDDCGGRSHSRGRGRGRGKGTKVHRLIEHKAYKILNRFGHERSSDYSDLFHNTTFKRAIRLSGAIKTIANGFISGDLKPCHVTIRRGQAAGVIDLMNGASPPSITAFTCLVDAVEFPWTISSGRILLFLNNNKALEDQAYFGGNGIWMLNEMGLVSLLKTLHPIASKQEEKKVVSSRDGNGDDKNKEKQNRYCNPIKVYKRQRFIEKKK